MMFTNENMCWTICLGLLIILVPNLKSIEPVSIGHTKGQALRNMTRCLLS